LPIVWVEVDLRAFGQTFAGLTVAVKPGYVISQATDFFKARSI